MIHASALQYVTSGVTSYKKPSCRKGKPDHTLISECQKNANEGSVQYPCLEE